MGIEDKMAVLADAAKYDASCSSSGSNRKGATGATLPSGCCHSWTPDGRCVSLLKILLSNVCIYDCAYCINRCGNDVPRATFTVEEVVNLTVEFYRRNYIEGLFLSSGVFVSPDHTMEQLMRVARTLREEKRFGGYIHLKAIPGASMELIDRAGRYADRVSVNIELPSSVSLAKLAPQKKKDDIIRPMAYIGEHWKQAKAERKKNRKAPRFAPAGHSTQMIVGATPESDKHILDLSQNLYDSYSLKRVYFSAYIPINTNESRLPVLPMPPLLREHRLYQADWLLRMYKFKAHELLSESEPNLDPQLDPKAGWALRNFQHFPIEINTADYEWLLRVPGVGVLSAKRILSARRNSNLDFSHLKRIGVVLKRAQYFITCNGKFSAGIRLSSTSVRRALLLKDKPSAKAEQLQLF
ncbi:putative DNA modification/repair radical SAM protein [Pontiellaceae bacterium B12227]|nr:putative DNA modification/repair radical SAM protein [Pontiellaceae bacterium B12227]